MTQNLEVRLTSIYNQRKIFINDMYIDKCDEEYIKNELNYV